MSRITLVRQSVLDIDHKQKYQQKYQVPNGTLLKN